MKKVVLAAFVAALLVAPAVEARPRVGGGGRPFESNKTFGLGIMLGAPAGLAGKYYLGSDTAIDFGVGAYYRFRYHDALHVFADFLWHPLVIASPDPFELALYLGIGGRLLSHDAHRGDYGDGSHFGIRAPGGLLLDFNRVPLDIFFELAFVADVISDDDHGYVDITGSLGVRYYF